MQLALVFARYGLRVLVCVMDPQANTTRGLGTDYDTDNPIVTMSEAGRVGAVRRLKRALEGWTDEYDVVLIDTLPASVPLSRWHSQ